MERPRIGLVLHPQRDAKSVAETIVRWARSHGNQVLVREQDVARCPDGVDAVIEAELGRSAQALISLGGDGTMLGALRMVAHRPVPVLGVNLGQVGFLVEIQPDELTAALDRLASGDFTVEEHSAVLLHTGEEELVAFNDVVLARVPGEGAVHAGLSVAGHRSGRFRCDALIVATPIGSTAYSYAAGGPVVSPTLDAVVVTAVAPMSGISRPMVVSAEEPVTLTLLEGSGRPALEVDGVVVRHAQPGDVFEMRLQPDAGLVVRLDRERHQRRNQVKLSLLDLPFLPDELRELAPESLPLADSSLTGCEPPGTGGK